MIIMSKTLDTLMKELKKTNAETYYHCLRTKKYVNELITLLNSAGIIKYLPEEIDAVCKGAVLHDIGKLKIKNVILTKDTHLTDEEKEYIHKHTELGYELVKNELDEPEYDVVCNICRYHHERIDGSGYNGMNELPMYVQIVAICDAFDALYSDRIYRNGLSKEKAMDVITKGECGKFDETLVENLWKIVRSIQE